METQFMGETEAKMTTTHMIERDPATFHEIWHEAWREAWEATESEIQGLIDLGWDLIDKANDINPGLPETLAFRRAIKAVE